MMKINYVLPGFYMYNRLNSALLDAMRVFKDMFYDNVRVSAVYDCFPEMKWNGGRCTLGEYDIREVLDIIKNYTEREIPLRFTFTNNQIKYEDLSDTMCNLTVKTLENDKNEIIVNSSILESHLRKKYPRYNFISSTTKGLDFESFLEELNKDYKLVVMDYNLNNNLKVLDSIPVELRHKVEIIADEFCAPNCRFRQEHYSDISKSQMEGRKSDYQCHNPIFGSVFFTARDLFNTFIKVEDIFHVYAPRGYTTFKLVGRGVHELDVIESYVYYMVKTEYHDFIRYFLTRATIGETYWNLQGGNTSAITR